jgi:pimeloyl-ACP methyl ester carboxylesterase
MTPRVVGDRGPTVLLLPGGAEEVEGFFPGLVEGLLADPGCRVVLWDRPPVLADAPAAIHAVLAEVGPAVTVGQSLGGAAALLHACAHPDDVAGLVLLDATPVNDPALARQVAGAMRASLRVARLPFGKRFLGATMRMATERSVRRHDMDDDVAAAARRTAQVDLARLGRATEGLVALAGEFDESRIPRVPAAVVTADRKPGSAMHRAHERLAEALDTPLLSWPGAEHLVHLTHPGEVLEATRSVVRRAGSRRC